MARPSPGYPAPRARVETPPGPVADFHPRGGDVHHSTGGSKTSTAGNLAVMQLFNPEDSGVLVLVDWVSPKLNVADQLVVRETDTRLEDFVRRWRSWAPRSEEGRAELRARDGAGLAGRILWNLASDGFVDSIPWAVNVILWPGRGLLVQHIAVGVNQLFVSFAGRERPL